MEMASAAAVIGQDENTELHVQVLVQSGRRQLDIRVWRRGPSGFAPSRSALTLEIDDLDALRAGVADLLTASDDGQEAVRLVWDQSEGRRLRGEIEPFGTRFIARFGFWQRVRDTWRPVDDGLVLGAAHLTTLLAIIEECRPRLLAPDTDGRADPGNSLPQEDLRRWPNPGADWLTSEPDRLAFHPRGVRITAAVTDDKEGHRLVLQQWQRHESLWLPAEHVLSLHVLEVDALLSLLHSLSDRQGNDNQVSIDTVGDGAIQVRIEGAVDGLLYIERERMDDAPTGIYLPMAELGRFGRMLAQSGMLLIARLSSVERHDLEERKGPELAPEIVSDALPVSVDEPTEAEESHGTPESEVVIEEAATAGVEVEPVRRLTPLGELRLGRHAVFLYLEEERERLMALQWDGYALLAPLHSLDSILSNLRDLYYDALRGRRGQVCSVGERTPLVMRVHNEGSSIFVLLEQEMDGKRNRLQFPVDQVPAFLDAVQAAANKLR